MGFMFFLTFWIKLLQWKSENKLLNFLYWEFSFMLFVYFRNLFFVSDSIDSNEIYLRVNNCIDVMIIPYTASFLITILVPQKLSKRGIFFLHIPSAFLSILYFFTLSNTVLFMIAIYTCLFSVIFLIFILLASSRHENYIRNNFSDIDQITVSWIRKGVGLLFCFLIVWGYTNYTNDYISTIIYNLFAILLWFLLYKHTINQRQIENTPDFFIASSKTEPDHILSEKYNFADRLNQYMEKEQPYLNPTLSIAELAGKIGTNKTYLSDYLNNSLSLTFYDFIGEYRIKTSCDLLKDTNLTIEQVAEKSGFNSLTTFRRTFIKYQKCTPKEYRKIRDTE